MWLEQSIGTCQENVGLNERRDGMTMFQRVLGNEDNKLLWDFSVPTDHEIGARRPDLVIIDKRDKS